MENLCMLLFELSNEDRLRILYKLSEKAMNATNLSKALNLTIQESSRHLSRLADTALIKKDANGFNRLTIYGELILKQLKELKFTSQHKDYFTTHSLVHIPLEFINRIGHMANSTYSDDISGSFYRIEKMIKEAEKYILTITDNYLLNVNFLIGEACERGVEVKNIEAKDWVVTPEYRQAYYAEEYAAKRQKILKARTSGLLQESVLEQLDVYLYMSEKEVAVVGFPFPDGRFDYLGFSASDERARKWCKDLFQYFWERARPRTNVVEELYTWIKRRPKALYALKKIAEGKEVANDKELMAELEGKALIKQGKLTNLALFLLQRI